MAKKNGELATQPQNAALANAADVRPWQFEGEDQDDLLIPRVTIHQGDISEKNYGQHEKGTLIDTTTCAEIPSRKFSPVCGWKEWIKWGANRGDSPEYRTRNRADVPQEDMQWHGDEPPAADLFRNFVVLFEGLDTPVVLSMKESSKYQRNAGKLLNQLEKVRRATGKGCGLYEIEIVDASNDQGKWKDMRIKPCGNPTPEFAALVAQWSDAMAGRTVQVKQEDTPF